MIDVTDQMLDPQAVRDALRDPAAGALVVFEGCARDHHQGRPVELLAYEAFVPMAVAELDRIRAEALARFGLTGCAIHHRTGTVPLTEAAVVVGCASAHRREAFAAVAWIMDRIKESVPIWKRESYPDAAPAWVEGENRERA